MQDDRRPDSGRPIDSRRRLGAEGEARAARFLEERGWRILVRNARAAGVELDLVAARGGVLAVVEVKTRRGERHGAAEEAVDARKQRRLVRGGLAWLREQRARPRRLRFDVVVCVRGTDGWRVRHWPGAFDASDL